MVLTKQTHNTQDEHSKPKHHNLKPNQPGLVASYDIVPENRQSLVV